MEGWEEGRRGGGRAGALMPLEGEGQDRQLKMGGVPNPSQAVWVSLSPGWPWFKPQLKQVPTKPGARLRLHPSLESNRGFFLLGTQGINSSCSHRDRPL